MDDEMSGFEQCGICEGWFDRDDLRDDICAECRDAVQEATEGL